MTAELLLLVTQSHPFGRHVDFLEDEIAHLAENFRTVRISPLAPEGSAQTVPSNVTLDLTLARRVQSRRDRVGATLRSRLAWSLLVSELTTAPQPKRHVEAFGRLAAAAGLAGETARWVQSLGPLPEKTIGLTVWLGGATVGMGRSGVRTVSRAHGGDLFLTRAPHEYIPLQKQQLLACDAVMSVSNAGRDDLQRRFPDLADRCRTRRLGVEGAVAVGCPSLDGTLRVVSCSSLIAVKRPLLLVEVVRELGRDGSRLQWHHFGAGPMYAEVRAAAGSLQPTTEVIFHGQVENKTVLTHYETQAVDVFLNVSASEGVPVSMMEAISAGIPIVGTDVGGVGEIVSVVTGALVPADAAPSAIAAAVRMQSARGRDGHREMIRSEWAERFSAERNYAEFAQELARLAEETHQ